MAKELEKTLKKENCKMKNKSSLVGFALAGLAAGAAAWYLFGTKEGRKNLNKAVEGFNEFSSTLKDKASDGLDYASDFADKAKKKAKKKFEEGKNKFAHVADDLLEKGKHLKDDATELGRKAAHDAQSLAEDAKNKFSN